MVFARGHIYTSALRGLGGVLRGEEKPGMLAYGAVVVQRQGRFWPRKNLRGTDTVEALPGRRLIRINGEFKLGLVFYACILRHV